MAETVRQNNFDALRLYAAVSVLVSHAFPHSYGSNSFEPIWRVSRRQATLGEVAVAIFFIISGYLITQSYARRRSPLQFIWARGLRLLPGLAVTLLLCAGVLGPLVTTVSLADYVRDPKTFTFVAVNLSLTGFAYQLPGVFTTTPFPQAVDGSLWTLQYEVACYLGVLLLGLTGWLNRWVALALFCLNLLAMKFWLGGPLVIFGGYFLGGAVMYLWQPPLRRAYAAIALAVLVTALLTGGWRLAAASAGAYLVIYAALSQVRLPRPSRADLSYGLYIWAFPVQQAVSQLLGGSAAWWANILISTPVAFGLAGLSWHLVEAPALSLRTLFLRAPLAQRAESPARAPGQVGALVLKVFD
jgi:peptidoglycan/LPS O-acetylase OafA/YrhL